MAIYNSIFEPACSNAKHQSFGGKYPLFAENKVESVTFNSTFDFARAPMRRWVLCKLTWNPDLNIEELIFDYIFGYYREAAPEIVEYHKLIWEHAVKYLDFNKMRDCFFYIHEEDMYRHDFISKGRRILDSAFDAAQSDEIRKRVEMMKLGIVYIDCVQLLTQMQKNKKSTKPKTLLESHG